MADEIELYLDICHCENRCSLFKEISSFTSRRYLAIAPCHFSFLPRLLNRCSSSQYFKVARSQN
ncbi:MAG: hypothetical protein HWQ35_24205 [Nostoc sp. NMS1]|uniref:hypothetical protein n=1 Tax=unclassified Nostoc TaxID=2593658 RepID=UPI0025E6C766|nr:MULTISPECIES: hypothetical protein [unclassified Nostoc]MBN3909527.1 hypothetical protein [Nostoc sp. NMS1]MBN3990894.1 hypothetical protein [Nostoc sp. NMS2]